MDFKLKFTGNRINELLDLASTALQPKDISRYVDKEFLMRYVVSKMKKYGDYLYALDYETIDYDYAKEYYYAKNPRMTPVGCSSVRNGCFYGRNFDWFYNNTVEFLVRTPHAQNRLAVMGICGNISDLTKSIVESRTYSDSYRILPFQLLDGINECGVFCNVNVVPTDKGLTTITQPTILEKERICTTMICRYILDNFQTAQSAIDYIRQYVALYVPKSLQTMGYEPHFMVGDATATYVVEIVENKIKVIQQSRMTNFYLHGVEFNENGKVYTPADVADENLPSVKNKITKYGSGLERYNLIVDRYASASTKDGMRSLMNDLLYTKTYLSAPVVADPVWHTEYVGGAFTIDTLPANFQPVEDFCADIFSKRDRNTPASEVQTWQTSHSSVYDLSTLRLYVVSQEDTENELVFDLFEEEEGKNMKVPVRNEMPEGGMLPNIFYRLGTITNETTLFLAPESDCTCYNEYMIEFTAGTDKIYFDESVLGWVNDVEPTIIIGKTYQISIVDGVGCFGEITLNH